MSSANVIVRATTPCDLVFPTEFAAAVTASQHRHKWSHIRDVTLVQRKRDSVRLTAKGEYGCICGAIKRGPPVGGL